MSVVQFLKSLIARRVQVPAARSHDIVSAICRGVVDRLVLAHEDQGDGGRDATQAAWIRANVDLVPYSRVRETGLGANECVRECWLCQVGPYRTFPTVADMRTVTAAISS